MRIHLSFLAALTLAASSLHAASPFYDMAAVREAASLETKVLADWHVEKTEPPTRQKAVEVTVCEWWPGQKVRLHVVMVAPVDVPGGGPVKNLIVDATGMTSTKQRLDATAAALVKRGVGMVHIAMTEVSQMDSDGRLDAEMNRRFIASRDIRYTPYWFWGMSYMRALTAALAEHDVFQPTKVLATGGSKRGVATTSSCIADDRFTAIVPVVAPTGALPLTVWPGIEAAPPEVAKDNAEFMARINSGGSPFNEVERGRIVDFVQRINSRPQRGGMKAAGWTDADFTRVQTQLGDLMLVTMHMDELKARHIEMFFQCGSNDNVSPSLMELPTDSSRPQIFILPGGQHGSANTGFTRRTPGSDEVEANTMAMMSDHFFGDRPIPASPAIEVARTGNTVNVKVPTNGAKRDLTVFWCYREHPDNSLAYQYETWHSAPMVSYGAMSTAAIVETTGDEKRPLDVVALYRDEHPTMPVYVSTPLVRLKP